jgi:hypothetical protein
MYNILEYSYVPQTYSYQTRKRRQNKSIKTNIKTPLKRCCLTKKNLKTLKRIAEHTKKDTKSKLSQPQKSNSFYSKATSKLLKTFKSLSKTVFITDLSFLCFVFKNSVFDPLNSVPPKNLSCL